MARADPFLPTPDDAPSVLDLIYACGIAVRQYEPGRRFWGDLYVHPEVREGSAGQWAIAVADEWGHVPEPFEEWTSCKLEHEEFDPANWWVAWGGRPGRRPTAP